ncbi:hypothetical protein JDV02_008982 [Purpureocillium takamizusanense]|uniref:Uncharacterized protein n=1 Tax=Purpureocillium takamizusanense TaxID=2060973 RepID=A0A9Q8QQR4_9HYPO|nr:uncharacterized protein JDV02_008982 [Purpureocillium takamizusanense]UNI23146.1 hypothetical protein JDV02_008982 [Purpureocillium takamizusanense]
MLFPSAHHHHHHDSSPASSSSTSPSPSILLLLLHATTTNHKLPLPLLLLPRARGRFSPPPLPSSRPLSGLPASPANLQANLQACRPVRARLVPPPGSSQSVSSVIRSLAH